MLRRIAQGLPLVGALLCALTLFSGQGILPGFPPGVFLSRSALDGHGALSCSYTPITTATQSVAYTGATPSTSGGTPAYVYSISAGTLPTGFSLNTSTGVISGTDSSVETKTGIQLLVTDNVSATANCGGTFTITVSASTVIAHIEQGTCTIASGAATCTWNPASSYAFVVANTILIWNGENTSNSSAVNDVRDSATITVTNTTTITAARTTSPAYTLAVNFTLIEFSSGVNSVQAGDITIAAGGGATNTATISTVGANAFVLYQGCRFSISVGNAQPICAVALTNTTTVTATVDANASATQIVRYMVADLGTAIVTAVQPQAASMSATGTSGTDTITSVTTGNAILVYGGVSRALSGTATFASQNYENVLTNATTVTKTRSGTGTNARTDFYTVVSLAASALNGSVQHSTVALSAQTSNTSSAFSAVTLAKSFVNWGNFLAAGNSNVSQTAMSFTSTTQVTATVNAAGSPTAAFSVVQFNFLLKRDIDPANDNLPVGINAAA